MYGKYYQINVEIENLTGKNFVFNPNNIIALLTTYQTDKKTKIVSVKEQRKGVLLTSDEYISKVNTRQNILSAFNSFGEKSNAERAGYSSSVTTTNVNSNTNSYGSVHDYYNKNGIIVNANANTNISGKSTTQNYNGALAYMAQENADKKIQAFDEQLYQIKSELNQGYLKINTLEHRQRLLGFINLKYEKSDKIEILIPVNGKFYSFKYDNSQNIGLEENTDDASLEVISQNNDINVLFAEFKSLSNNKQVEKSFEILNKALAIESTNCVLLRQRSKLNFFKLNKPQGGISDISSAIFNESDLDKQFENLLIRASYYFQLNDFSNAIKDATSAIEIHPNKTEGYFSRALSTSRRGEMMNAIKDYEKIISITDKLLAKYDNAGVVYNNIGYCYVQLKEYKKAFQYINKALELLPNHSFIWGSRGELNYKLGEYKDCISDLTIAIDLMEKGNDKGKSLNPSNPYYYRALAFLKIHKRKEKEICYDLNKAVELGNIEAILLQSENCKN
jgi:tetratricopeptide (TPR) repeat protein